MSGPQVIYHPRPDATPEAELDALAGVYALAIQKCQDKEKGAHPGAPDDAEGRSNDGANISIPPIPS